jgi:accessory gene regulator protein AgrB
MSLSVSYATIIEREFNNEGLWVYLSFSFLCNVLSVLRFTVSDYTFIGQQANIYNIVIYYGDKSKLKMCV